MRHRKGRVLRFLTVLVLVFAISSFCLMIAVMVDVEVVSDEFHHRNSCVSSLMGVPLSFIGSECFIGGSCHNITCEKLFAGDLQATAEAQKFSRKSMSDDDVAKFASDCNRLRYVGEYQMTPVRSADVDFPIAFTLLLHMNAEQFERLLRAIYRPQNVYCVHVDTKSSQSYQSAVKAVINCFDNVFLATRLHRIVYAGPSRLQVCFFPCGVLI